MSFESTFDQMIEYIEEHIREDKGSILKKATEMFLLNEGIIGQGFRFVTGCTLNEYIKQRRVVHALKYWLDYKCSLNAAAERYLISDQPTLSKLCKTLFDGKTPKQITQQVLSQKKPYTLAYVLKKGRNDTTMDDECSEKEQRFLGVMPEQYNVIKRMLELNSVYAYEEKQLSQIFELSKTYHVELEKVFEFMSWFDWDEKECPNEERSEEEFYDSFDDYYVDKKSCFDDIAFLCLDMGVSFSETNGIIMALREEGIVNLRRLDRATLSLYLSDAAKDNIQSYAECKGLPQLMKECHVDLEDFEEVLLNSNTFYNGDIAEAIRNFHKDKKREELYLKEYDYEMDMYWTSENLELDREYGMDQERDRWLSE